MSRAYLGDVGRDLSIHGPFVQPCALFSHSVLTARANAGRIGLGCELTYELSPGAPDSRRQKRS